MPRPFAGMKIQNPRFAAYFRRLVQARGFKPDSFRSAAKNTILSYCKIKPGAGFDEATMRSIAEELKEDPDRMVLFAVSNLLTEGSVLSLLSNFGYYDLCGESNARETIGYKLIAKGTTVREADLLRVLALYCMVKEGNGLAAQQLIKLSSSLSPPLHRRMLFKGLAVSAFPEDGSDGVNRLIELSAYKDEVCDPPELQLELAIMYSLFRSGNEIKAYEFANQLASMIRHEAFGIDRLHLLTCSLAIADRNNLECLDLESQLIGYLGTSPL
ncbi:MAG: hypothetical protein SFY68_01995 [Candidatus Sumerlaeia bacterium]|nr:hypothetical protein [Candidatus Sumerlaeia bacterium]